MGRGAAAWVERRFEALSESTRKEGGDQLLVFVIISDIILMVGLIWDCWPLFVSHNNLYMLLKISDNGQPLAHPCTCTHPCTYPSVIV